MVDPGSDSVEVRIFAKVLKFQRIMPRKKQESEILEYKESLAEKEVAGRDICAFANKKGGVLFFGLKNDGTCKGLGSITEKTIRDLSQFYHDNFEPRLYPEIEAEECEGKTVIKVTVEKSATPHHTFKNIPSASQMCKFPLKICYHH